MSRSEAVDDLRLAGIAGLPLAQRQTRVEPVVRPEDELRVVEAERVDERLRVSAGREVPGPPEDVRRLEALVELVLEVGLHVLMDAREGRLLLIRGGGVLVPVVVVAPVGLQPEPPGQVGGELLEPGKRAGRRAERRRSALLRQVVRREVGVLQAEAAVFEAVPERRVRRAALEPGRVRQARGANRASKKPTSRARSPEGTGRRA